jgi:hypothetical protein
MNKRLGGAGWGIVEDRGGRTLALQDFGVRARHLARALASALGLTAVLNCPSTALASNTYIVNTTGDPGPSGKLSLRQAVAAAAPGDTVQFDPSLTGSTITLATGQINIAHAVNIVGPGMDRLTISGAGSGRIFYLSCPSPASVVAISSLSLTNGAAVSGGGAIGSHDCYMHLSDVRATSSHATSGGCITFNGGMITNSVVSGCSASSVGGGIQVTYGFANSQIYQSTISSNTAVLGGGGVFLDDASHSNYLRSTIISQSTINNNRVTSQSDLQYGGGGIAVLHSMLSLRYSTVTQNQSHKTGGGISLADSYSANRSNVFRSTVAHNSAYKTAGNGLYTVGGSLIVQYSIIADNFSKYALTDLFGTFFLYKSLVQSPGNATITGTGSLIGSDPDLANLDDNGGATATMLPNPGSPAIDAIPGCGIPMDQRGLQGCANGKSDMGAVERQVPEVIIFRNGFESG